MHKKLKQNLRGDDRSGTPSLRTPEGSRLVLGTPRAGGDDASHIQPLAELLAESAPVRLVVGHVGRLLMFWHVQSTPSDAEWNDGLQRLRASPPDARVLVLTDGGKPSLPQQARLRQVLAGRREGLRVAVLSDEVHVRFIASTLALLTKRLRTFSSADVEGAFAHLELAEIEHGAALHFIARRDAQHCAP